jgi:hypothetical protein
MSSDTPTWLTRAHRNTRGVQPVLWLPWDFTGIASDYELGINLSMRMIQWYFYRQCKKTFRRFPVITKYGAEPASKLIQQGMKENTAMILGPLAADPTKVYVLYAPAPTGYLGGTIGIDQFAANDGTNPAYPWPGRTGLTGKGLECISFNQGTIVYRADGDRPNIGYDPTDNTYKYEGSADEFEEWCGAVAHELGHCFCGLPHQSGSLMYSWWNFNRQGRQPLNIPLLPDEISKLNATVWFR